MWERILPSARAGTAGVDGADSPAIRRESQVPHAIDFDPREPGSRRRDRGNREDPGRRALALCPLRAAAGTQGHAVRVSGPRRVHREIFRGGARCARPRVRGRDHRLARAGALRARAAECPQGACARFLPVRSRPRGVREGGGAARLPAAAVRARALDGRRGAAARRLSGAALVRPHRALGADDRSARRGRLALCPHERARAADDGAGVAVRAGRRRDRDQHASVSRQQSHLGSGPLRAHGRRSWRPSPRSASARRRLAG